MAFRITLTRVRQQPVQNINQELQWLGSALGLFNQRDRDSSCFRVFITLVKHSPKEQPLSSDEIAERLKLSRGTVVHHLHRMMDSGIVVHEREGYLLRENELPQLIDRMQKDVEAMFAELRKVAQEIDEKLG